MRKSKNHRISSGGFRISPSPTIISRQPKALKREISTNAQKDFLEEIIKWGSDNAFPLRMARAVQDSPATTACLNTLAQYIKGAGFSEPELERQIINKNGDTLWSLHSKLSDSCSFFEGFSANLKFNSDLQITNAYEIAFESLRFVKPKEELSNDIECIKYNPYFGTDEYRIEFTKKYPLYNKSLLPAQLQEYGNTFPGQVYYYGKTSPLFRFYPNPKYWAAKDWIRIDGKIQEFHSENLDNGFFQSVLMNVIGDPNAPSENPKYQKTSTNPDTGETTTESTKTVGEEFNEEMQEEFSGSKKAGNVMVMWSLNADTVAKIQSFPSNTNADLFTALQDLTTKNITIATRVPSILANISEGVALGSGGSEIQKAIELMQAQAVEWQMALEQFYNEVLLPGMGVAKKVTIMRYNPISTPPTIEDKVWEWLNDQEKTEWIKKNYSDITLFRGATPVPGQPSLTDAPTPTGNTALANLSMAQLNKMQKIAARYQLSLSDPTNTRALTYDQAKQLLAGYGLTEEEINAWIVTPDELNQND